MVKIPEWDGFHPDHNSEHWTEADEYQARRQYYGSQFRIYGAGTGGADKVSRRVDRFFDGLITVGILAVGAFAIYCLFGMLAIK